MSRRFSIFVAFTFAVSFSSWGAAAALAREGRITSGQTPFLLLYAAGGLGPTAAAYVSVLCTKAASPLNEYHRRLLRWRLAARWYLIAILLPIAISLASVEAAIALDSSGARSFAAGPWYRFIGLWFVMIAGGGLEELGWRGVAQSELERRFARPMAALCVGLIWSVWHLPLFFLPGVGQYGANFPIFAVSTVGNAMILAWLYGRTESILPCIAFHASINAIWEFMAISSRGLTAQVVDAGLKILFGCVLVTTHL